MRLSCRVKEGEPLSVVLAKYWPRIPALVKPPPAFKSARDSSCSKTARREAGDSRGERLRLSSGRRRPPKVTLALLSRRKTNSFSSAHDTFPALRMHRILNLELAAVGRKRNTVLSAPSPGGLFPQAAMTDDCSPLNFIRNNTNGWVVVFLAVVAGNGAPEPGFTCGPFTAWFGAVAAGGISVLGPSLHLLPRLDLVWHSCQTYLP